MRGGIFTGDYQRNRESPSISQCMVCCFVLLVGHSGGVIGVVDSRLSRGGTRSSPP